MNNKKAIAIGYLANVSLGNVNASHTEGNVMVAKKVTLPDGSTIPYISGQAIRRMIRDRLEDLGWQLSEPFSLVSGQEVVPPVKPWKYIDEDIFGYMDTKQNRRRTSPVRVSSLIGLFKFHGDRDLGTRSFEKFGQAMEAGGNMFETEVYNNLFKGNILIEIDRVGFYLDLEVGKDTDTTPENCEKIELPEEIWGKNRWAFVLNTEEKMKRLSGFHDAIKYLWGGGRTARMLVDLSPRFIAIMFLKVKHPVFLEAFKVDYETSYRLEDKLIAQAIKRFEGRYDTVVFGLDPGFFENEGEIEKTLRELGEVMTVSEAINFAKDKLKEQ